MIEAAMLRGKRPPPAMLAPLAPLSIVTAYQWDLAYGTKLERINQHFNDIIEKEQEQHWFLPLRVDQSSKPKSKEN